jgi:hypothetical protein
MSRFFVFLAVFLFPCFSLKQVELIGIKAKTNAKTRLGAKILKTQSHTVI